MQASCPVVSGRVWPQPAHGRGFPPGPCTFSSHHTTGSRRMSEIFLRTALNTDQINKEMKFLTSGLTFTQQNKPTRTFRLYSLDIYGHPASIHRITLSFKSIQPRLSQHTSGLHWKSGPGFTKMSDKFDNRTDAYRTLMQ